MNTMTMDAATVLTDLSACDRIGLKGREATTWLQSYGLELPAQANQWIQIEDGLLVGRYAENEYVLASVDQAATPRVEEFRQALEDQIPAGCYSVPRVDSQVMFKLSGQHVMGVLSAVRARLMKAC